MTRPQTSDHPAAPSGIALPGALSLIITNMVGTGVFTSLGFQLVSLDQASSIVLLWGLGGLIALAGAAVYAELGVTFPGSGGEFNFLSRIYHPVVGFLAGWLSTVVGFAAPIALSTIAFGAYVARVVPGVDATAVAVAALAAVTLLHLRGVRQGVLTQQLFTVGILVVALLLLAARIATPSTITLSWSFSSEVFSAPFAVALIYVEYAYSGWNSVAYFAGEVRDPTRSLPRALLGGTSLVCLLYLALNLTFLASAPAEELRGQVEVAHIAASHLLGPIGSRTMSVILAGALLGSVSSMLFAGARLPATMAETYPALAFLRRRNRAGSPTHAILLQAGIALVMVVTGTFESVLTFVGFLLTVCTTLTVAGLFLVRRRGHSSEASYRCWGYPFSPLLFLTVNLWMLSFLLWSRPTIAIAGTLVIAAGIPVWWWIRGSGVRTDPVRGR